ncbi:MAG: hypothetical protein JJ896_14875 [Rhodothermales bacterium]|nr:hypothetical protein [Rhodothermales bacterium]MBO6780935.1 hypothetical protein [Rhodothermales bacterium]
MRALVAAILLVSLSACDTQKAINQFEEEAALPPAGITRTDRDGVVESWDDDDWRTSPAFFGKVRVDPAYPNPVPSGVVTVPVSVLEFNAVQGGLVLRARDSTGRLSLVDEIRDASDPGGYIFQFAPAILARSGLVRVFVLDRVGNLVSYGDLELQ